MKLNKLFFLFSAICLKQISAEEVLNAQQFLQQAKQQQVQGQYSKALYSYDKAISLEPKNYLSYFKRATVYLSIGKSSEAINDFSKVLELKPDLHNALQQRGKIYLQEGDFLNAINDFQLYLKSHPNDETTQKNLADALQAKVDFAEGLAAFHKGNCEKTTESFSKVISTSPHNVDIRMKRADCYLKLGNLESAAGDYLRASKIKPDNTLALLQLSKVRLSLGETGDAITSLKECLKFDIDHKECKKSFKELKKFDKEFNKVQETFKKNMFRSVLKLIEGEGDSVEQKKKTGLIYKVKELNIGGNKLKSLLELVCRSKFGVSNSNDEDTLKSCQEVLNLDADNVEALIIKADISMKNENYEEAMRDYKKAHEVSGGDHRAQEGYNKAQRLLKQQGQKNYYKVLGVERNASKKQIKKAFRTLAKIHHPDKQPASEKEKATKKYSEINEAYEVLMDDEKRQKFDNGEDPNDQSQQFNQPNFHQFFQGGGQLSKAIDLRRDFRCIRKGLKRRWWYLRKLRDSLEHNPFVTRFYINHAKVVEENYFGDTSVLESVPTALNNCFHSLNNFERDLNDILV
ncbi:DnaJ sub C member 3 [Lobulomyces angularis]|nr:DnaJ sub C member 3 [Lobulomyces angularis]